MVWGIIGSALTGTTDPDALFLTFVRDRIIPAIQLAVAVAPEDRTPTERQLASIAEKARKVAADKAADDAELQSDISTLLERRWLQTGPDGDELQANIPTLREELTGALEFILPQSAPLPELLEKLGNILLNPSYVPGEPCLAPAPLLRDLLDVALGRITGGIGATIAKVGQTVWDFLLPAFGEEQFLTDAIQSILADPVTAALNWILGKREQIDCPVEASLGVATSVFGDQIRHIEEALSGALP